MGEEQKVQTFIERWGNSGAAERANGQSFLTELCALLDVPPPDPATPDTRLNAYVFERDVTFHHGDGTSSTGRIDLYKRGCFVLEAKQGSDEQKTADPLDLAKPKLKKGTAKPVRWRTDGIRWGELSIRER